MKRNRCCGISVDELTHTVGEFLGRIKHGAESTAMDTLVGMDLTLTQLRVILVLMNSDDPRPIFEIADALHLSVATTGRAVERLVQVGIATRWEDPADRRSKLVRLTEEGLELTEIQRHAMLDQIRSFCRDLPADVAASLHAALRQALECAPSRSASHATPQPSK